MKEDLRRKLKRNIRCHTNTKNKMFVIDYLGKIGKNEQTNIKMLRKCKSFTFLKRLHVVNLHLHCVYIYVNIRNFLLQKKQESVSHLLLRTKKKQLKHQQKSKTKRRIRRER